MPQIIRQGVFETNSSSTHSISISDQYIFENIIPDKDGVITVKPQEFGWDYCQYDSPEDKLSYMAIYVRNWVHSEKQVQFQDTLNRCVMEHTGATSVVYPGEDESKWGSNEGYIDHQSVECSDYDYVLQDPDLLKRFIFGSESVLITDNDNH